MPFNGIRPQDVACEMTGTFINYLLAKVSN